MEELLKELLSSVNGINNRLDNIDKRLDAIQNDINELTERTVITQSDIMSVRMETRHMTKNMPNYADRITKLN